MKNIIKFELTDEEVENILDAAMNYCSFWAADSRLILSPTEREYSTFNYQSHALTHGCRLNIKDDETEKWHQLTLKKFLKGISAAVKSGELDLEDYDGPQADTALQHALFGEVLYG